jgi:hypothetical protein
VRRDRKEVDLESSEERREIVSEFGGDLDRTFSLPEISRAYHGKQLR